MHAVRLLALLLASGCQGSSDPLYMVHGGEPRDPSGADTPGGETAFGFTTFPYDMTQEALDRVHSLVAELGSLYTVHFDNGIPWREALEDEPFPDELEQEWDELAGRQPPGHVVYVALSPLATDRESLAPASEGYSMPLEMRGAALDDELVKRAWTNYVRRAVVRFDPDYINLGIEAGEMAGRAPRKWNRFVELFEHVRAQIKRDRPELQVGISFGLQMLAEADVAERARSLVESCDYLGLSFYPYMSEFHERFGTAPLPPPPDQWRRPLAWVSTYTDKPVAVCETGYTTRSVELNDYDIHMQGTPSLQASYVEDLAEFARRDGYAFVVWYLAVDYDALHEQLPPDDGTNSIWRNAGLFDRDLRPKPALEAWRRLFVEGAPVRGEPSLPPSFSLIGHGGQSMPFEGPAGTELAYEDRTGTPGERALRWSFRYERGQWAWCVRNVPEGTLAGIDALEFSLRSDRAGLVAVQLEERGGEAFAAFVPTSATWNRVELRRADFVADDEKRQNGELELERVTSILLADPAAADDEAVGRRTIWIAR